MQSMFVETPPSCAPAPVYPTTIPAVFLTEPIKSKECVPEDARPESGTQQVHCQKHSSTFLVITLSQIVSVG